MSASTQTRVKQSKIVSPLILWLKQYWLLFLPLTLLLPGLNGFPYPSLDTPYSDITVSHYPNALYLIRSITEYGQIPLWSNTILSGYPFFANPLSGLHYPPGWLALLFPLPLGFNLIVMAHWLFGGIGMVKFLQKQGLSHPAVMLGALGFAAMPKMFAHYGAGHLSLMYAIPWTLWLLLAADTRRETNSRTWFHQPGLILAIIFMADPRWAVYSGLLWLGWEVRDLAREKWNWLKQTTGQVILAALLSAPLAIPLLEYARLSTRIHMTIDDILTFSLKPNQVLGFLFPAFGGAHEYTRYMGAVVLFLAVLALFNKSSRFWGWAALVSLLYAMGKYFPGMEFIAGLPGFSLLRIPARALFITDIALAVLAAYGLETLLTGLDEKVLKRFRLTIAGLAGFGVMIVIGVLVITGETQLNFLWGAAALLLGAVWLSLQTRVGKQTWLIGLFALVILDLFGLNQSLFAARNFDDVISEGREAAEFLADQPGRFRIYSPSYSIPQHTAAYYGLEMANGVDPLQLESYADFMERATGVPREGYSITLPPMGDDPDVANKEYIPNQSFLNTLTINYIVTEFDLLESEYNQWELIEQFNETRIYSPANKNTHTFPYFYFWNPVGMYEIDDYSWSPNIQSMKMGSSGDVFLSELVYPGWEVHISGIPTQTPSYDDITETFINGNFLSNFNLEYIFKPKSLLWGLLLFGLGALQLVYKQFKPKISGSTLPQAERRWVWGFALILMTLTMLPYLIGFASQGEDWVFSGFIFGVEDANSYIASMRNGAEGAWLFRSDYTYFEQAGLLVSLPYLLLGKLLSPSSPQTAYLTLYHAFRFAAGLVMVWGTYSFISAFIQEIKLRRWTLVVGVLGGGLGWLLVLLGQDNWLGSAPLDFYSPEAFGFLGLFGFPHLSLSRGLFLGGLGIYLNPDLPGSKNLIGLKIGLLFLALGLTQALSLGVAWVILAAHLGLLGAVTYYQKGNWSAWKGYLQQAVWAGVISLPLLFYLAYSLTTDPYAALWSAQNTITSPHPLHYLIAYLFFIPLAYFGAKRLWQADRPKTALLLGWVIVWPLLVYFPINVQRRFGEGFLVVLAVLAFSGLEQFPKLKQRLGLFTLTCLTTLLLYIGSIQAVLKPTAPIFMDADFALKLKILNNHPGFAPGSLVLSSSKTGNRLPAWTGVHTLIGLGPESIGGQELEAQVKAFYSSQTTDEERLAFLKEYQIDYVFWGPDEQALGDWVPPIDKSHPFLFPTETGRIYNFYTVRYLTIDQ